MIEMPRLHRFDALVKRKPKHVYCRYIEVYAMDVAHALEIIRYDYPQCHIFEIEDGEDWDDRGPIQIERWREPAPAPRNQKVTPLDAILDCAPA